MQIDLDLLFTWGAIAKEYKKNEIIYHIEDIPQASEKVIKIAHGSPDTHLLNTVLKL